LVRTKFFCTFADDFSYLFINPDGDRRQATHRKTLFIMAKGNMLLGHARGKVGSVVFSRAYGKQITRALAESVKNPRSDGQNVQRAIFATITGFTSAVRDVVDHSFQSTKEGQESVNRFVSINTKKLREAYLAGAPVDIMPKGAGLPYANAYRFSQGSLGLQNLFIGSVGSAGAQHFGVYQEQDWEGDVDNAAMLKACIPAFAPGCEIAVIKVYYNENEHFHYVTKDRAVFLSSFEGISPDNAIVDSNGINEDYLNMNKTTTAEVLKVIGGGSGNKILAVSENINEADNIGNKVVACVVIVSQKDANGKWIYTTSDMMCVPAWNELHDTDAAVASYGNASASETTSDLYLQQSASTAQEETNVPFNEMRKNIICSGAADHSATSQVSPFNLDVNTEAGAVNFEVNVAKGGNEIGQVQAIYRGEEEGMYVKNKDGVLKYSVSKAGNAVVVRGTITPRDTNATKKLAGWLDINIFAPQDVSGSNFTTIKFNPTT
jgi:hypothetical protein